MDHAITLKDVLIVIACGVGAIGVVGVIFGIIWLMNPFRSGH